MVEAGWGAIIAKDDGRVCENPGGICGFVGDHYLADARLAAAAPDLYEALRLILASIDATELSKLCSIAHEDALYRSFNRGMQAIEKAGGAEQCG